MAYAVVKFLEEDTFSEVPCSWLYAENKKCWWPPSKNLFSLMEKNAKPESTWTSHDNVVDNFCVTLKRARKLAQDNDYTSSEELGKTKRKRKPTSPLSSSSDEENCVTPPPIICESTAEPEAEDRSSRNTISQLLSPRVETPRSSDNTHELLTIILNYVKSIDGRLRNIETTRQNTNTNVDIILTFTNKCPIKDLDDLKQFEEYISNADQLNEFTEFVSRIGGRNAKDHLYRCLKTVYSNGMGKCSWLCQRGNYRLCDLKSMIMIRNMIINKYTSTNLNVEFLGSEWFRLAKLRLKKSHLHHKYSFHWLHHNIEGLM